MILKTSLINTWLCGHGHTHTDTQLQIVRKDTHTKEIQVYGKHAEPQHATVHLQENGPQPQTHRLYYDHCEPLSASLKLPFGLSVYLCVCIVTMLVFSERKKWLLEMTSQRRKPAFTNKVHTNTHYQSINIPAAEQLSQG